MRPLALLAAWALGACAYGAPVDQSAIDSAVALPDGSVAVTFRQIVYRPAAGLAAYPDGGIPSYLRDSEVVGVLANGRPGRILHALRNPGSAGSLHVTLRRAGVDPDHLMEVQSFQRADGGAAVRWYRLDWRTGQRVAYPDFAAELASRGRRLGSSEFGDVRVLDRSGALLLGATGDKGDELWLYQPPQAFTRIDGFKHFYGIAGDELYYWTRNEAVLRNWRTGAVRPVARYDPATRVTSRLAMDDPAVRQIERGAPEPLPATIATDHRSVRLRSPSGVDVTLTAPSQW